MDATRIIAIRHGETAWNVDTRIQGQLDVPLNDTGRWQAERLARALAAREAINVVYTSDLLRAWETARAVAESTGAPLIADEGLRERGFGAFQGKTFTEIEATLPDEAQRWRKRDPFWAPPGGESLTAMRRRVVENLAHAGVAPQGRTDRDGGARRRDGPAVPRRHRAGAAGAAHLAARQHRHQPPAVDAGRPVAGRLVGHLPPRRRVAR
jgi:broad specificity phosphatase PhoE